VNVDGLTAGAVARRLGVAVTTLRTWHQRYDLGPSAHEPGKQRRYTEAEPLLKRALQIREHSLGPTHPDLLSTLQTYADVLRKLARKSDAQQLELRAKALLPKP